MSDFAFWFVSQQLRNMGWARSKGLFNKVHYVDATLLDVVVEGVVQIAVGLGAGRPDLGVALLADIFADNPWTTESIDGLIQMLEKGEADIADAPNLFPWKALYKNEHRIAAHAKDFQWQDLGDPTINTVWTLVIAKGVFWGLTHDRDMPEVFTRVKEDYERTAREAIPDGLGVPPQLPWKTLDDFYEYCNEVVSAFESTQHSLPEAPATLMATPIIAKHLQRCAKSEFIAPTP